VKKEREGKEVVWHFGNYPRLKSDLHLNASSILPRCIIREDTISRPLLLYLKCGGNNTYLMRLLGATGNHGGA